MRLAGMLISLSLVACGTDKPPHLTRGIDAELKDPYIWVFGVATEVGLGFGHKIDRVAFGEPEPPQMGYCQRMTIKETSPWGQETYTPYRRIIIGRGYSDVRLYTLMAHEIGHCAYDLHHVDSPTELMNPTLVRYETMEELESALVRVLSALRLMLGED